jgi:hypothetical protein
MSITISDTETVGDASFGSPVNYSAAYILTSGDLTIEGTVTVQDTTNTFPVVGVSGYSGAPTLYIAFGGALRVTALASGENATGVQVIVPTKFTNAGTLMVGAAAFGVGLELSSGTFANSSTGWVSVQSSTGSAMGVWTEYQTNVNVTNAGLVTVSGATVGIGLNFASQGTITNSGTITVTSPGGAADGVVMGDQGVVINTGTIQVDGVSGAGVSAWSDLDLTNSGSIVAQRGAEGVQTRVGAVINNSGQITTGGGALPTIGIAIEPGVGDVDITNSGTITAGQAIAVLQSSTGGGTAVVHLHNTGTVNGSVADASQVFNTGHIVGDVYTTVEDGTEIYDGRGGTLSGTLFVYGYGSGGAKVHLGDDGEKVSGISAGMSLAIHGGAGNDTIIGGGSNDWIDGSRGNDTLTGVAGHDTFVMDQGVGNDVITNLDTAGDIIDVSAFFSSFAAVQAAAIQQGANTVIQLGSGSLTLDNVSVGALQARDFSFTAIPSPPDMTVTGTSANSFTATFEGVYRQYTVGAGGSTVAGGPEGYSDALVGIQRIQFVDGYLDYSATDPAGQVYRLYEATLGRAPDQEGLTNWVNELDSGVSLQTVANGFVGSQEFQADYGAALSNTDFVTLLYQNVLRRAPDASGLANWVAFLTSGQDTRAQVVLGFSESQENIADSAPAVKQGLWVGNPDAAEVARLYDAVLGRLPDLSGLTNWTNMLEAGTSLQTVANGFVGSQEFQTTYGALNNNQFVTLLYQNVLHRAPDAQGLNNWVTDLKTGQDTRAQVVLGFSESQEHIANMAPYIESGIWLA